MAKQDQSEYKVSILRNWHYYLFFFLMRLLSRLPYRVLISVGRKIGLIMYKYGKSRTRIARINISKCFPELSSEQQEHLVRENAISTGIGTIEMAMLWFGPQRDWSKLVEIEGLDHLEQAKRDGSGGLLLSFHLTSLEIGGSLLGTQFPIGALYRRNENPLIENAMVSGRKHFVHPIPREATRDMIKWIKNNGFVWYAADQDYGRKQSIFVPFFGIDTATITATTRFVKLTKAPVIPMTQRRDLKSGKIIVTIHPPITTMGDDAREDAIVINQFLEKYLAQYPAEYLWVHRRFKTRPNEDDPSFYPKKSKTRIVTPERFKNILNAAVKISEMDGEVTEIQLKHAHIKVIPRRKNLFGIYQEQVSKTIKPNDVYYDNDVVYRYNGYVRYCEFKQSDLAYFELD
ncbi:MAG: LpxL/LpxP family Kdo(2)-lipid IV(A) lauroyl/palmitoleoyl acyltransferase [Kangiellaceae bacterium]|jgi:KDO2-lipid IV(A) lauroyltransferase|nr:LpxL/LpxP family Kdo(2)-lipid IV(A) lauroyl/palmitoleoyl acyltransferase [Kangiellaceae bacterium]